MAYGHAERTLEAIRMLVAETRELLSEEPDLDAEQQQWLREQDGGVRQPCIVPNQQRRAGPSGRQVH